jgi:cobalt transporter subunit CbtB
MTILQSASASADSLEQQVGANVWRDRIAPSLVALLLGAGLIFATGFASKVELHNAAHDGRHSAGFPCH